MYVCSMDMLTIICLCFYYVFLTGEFLNDFFNTDFWKISQRAKRDPNHQNVSNVPIISEI